MEKKVKHLEMIQAIITRMANNSFFLKGWCVILVSALIALGARDSNKRFLLVGYYPILMSWILDAYFLRQERLFRKLYDEIRGKAEGEIDFSMDTSGLLDKPSWLLVACSRTLLLFYGAMVGAVLLAMLIVISS